MISLKDCLMTLLVGKREMEGIRLIFSYPERYSTHCALLLCCSLGHKDNKQSMLNLLERRVH